MSYDIMSSHSDVCFKVLFSIKYNKTYKYIIIA